MAYAMAITLRCREGAAETFRSVLADIAGPSRAEPANVAFEVARSVEDGNLFFVFESYVDEAGYEAHLRTPGFRRVEQELFPLLEDREVQTLETLVD